MFLPDYIETILENIVEVDVGDVIHYDDAWVIIMDCRNSAPVFEVALPFMGSSFS